MPAAPAGGWPILYHGVRHTPGGCLYRLGLALLDPTALSDLDFLRECPAA